MNAFVCTPQFRMITQSPFILFFRDLFGHLSRGGLLALLLVFGFASHSQGLQSTSGGQPNEDRDRQYRYAEMLYAQKRYIEAAESFERFVFFYPADPRIPTARYQAALSYYSGNHYDKAILTCRTAIDNNTDNNANARFYLLSASARVKKGDLNQALVTIHNILSIYEKLTIRDEAYHLGAWIYIQTGQWQEALSWMKNISIQNRNTPKIGSMVDRLNMIDTIPQKRPRLAGMLAAIPGAGHLYGARYQDAITSFLLNGLTAWASYEAFDNDLPVLGTLMGLVFINLYVGNIYSAVNTTHQYNRRANQQFIKGFEPPARLNISMAPQNGGMSLVLRLPF